MGQRSEVPQEEVSLWPLVNPASWLIAIVGVVLVVGVWIPANFGEPDWEFGTVNSFLDGLPLALIGLGLLAAGALAEGRRAVAVGVGLTLVAVAVGATLAGLLLAIDLPLAWRAAGSNALLLTALKKALAKGAIQVVVIPIVSMVIALKCLRRPS